MMQSWLVTPVDTDFSIYNLPFGVVSPTPHSLPRCATILGDTVIDLSILAEAQLFDDISGLSAHTFQQPTLNAFLEHPPAVWRAVRQRLQDLLLLQHNNDDDDDGGSAQVTDDRLRTNPALQTAAFLSIHTIHQLHLPIKVGDYTDFYSSRPHATNVGTMFRGKDQALQPNWLHLPVGYHGRASTVYVSGHDVRRPCGQVQKDKTDPRQGSIHVPTRRLDFELEVAAVVGGPPNYDQPLTIPQAKERIFGFVLMNDWSARDIQAWEYVPLGPFTSKNFATTISPWIVMAAALEEHGGVVVPPATTPPQDNPTPLPYLQDPDYSCYDVALQVGIRGAQQSTVTTICQSNFSNLYWNPAQQLVHHTVTGCVMRAGDLLGSGTISGHEENSFGSMLELSWQGTRNVPVGDEVRTFLNDGDTVVLTGYSDKPGLGRIGFGECSGTILPALMVEGEKISSPISVPRTTDVATERFQDFKLYGYWRSSSTWRVRVALAAKAIHYTTIPVNISKNEHRHEDYMAKNPMGQVPLLECTDTATGKVVRLAQSIAIMEFLDQIFPHRPSLFPQDPMDRALALEMVEVINAGTQPVQNIFMLQELEQLSGGRVSASEQAKRMNEIGLVALQVLVQRRRHESSSKRGPFCLGTFCPTVVDAVMVPQLYNARRFGVDVNSVLPLLVEIGACCAKHTWFQVSHPSVQPDAPH